MIDKIEVKVFNYDLPDFLIREDQIGNKVSFSFYNIKGHYYRDSKTANIVGSLSAFINNGLNSYPLIKLSDVHDAIEYLLSCMDINPFDTHLKSLEIAFDVSSSEKYDLTRIILPGNKLYKLFESQKNEFNVSFKLNRYEDIKIYENGIWNGRPEGYREELTIKNKGLPVRALEMWTPRTIYHLRDKVELITNKLIFNEPNFLPNHLDCRSLSQIQKRDHLTYISKLSEPEFRAYLSILNITDRKKREIEKNRLQFLKSQQPYLDQDLKQIFLNTLNNLL